MQDLPGVLAGLRSRFDLLPAGLLAYLSLLLWPGGGVLLYLLVESLPRTTWLAQPGRLVGSGSPLASFLPALPERGAGCLSHAPPISLLSSLPCGAGCRVRIRRILWPVLLLVALFAGAALLLLLHKL